MEEVDNAIDGVTHYFKGSKVCGLIVGISHLIHNVNKWIESKLVPFGTKINLVNCHFRFQIKVEMQNS